MQTVLLLPLGLFMLLVYAASLGSADAICNNCICPLENKPICGKQQVTGRLRGFTSMCVLNCTNQCRKNKFDFYKRGRCGKLPNNPRKPFVTPSPSGPIYELVPSK